MAARDKGVGSGPEWAEVIPTLQAAFLLRWVLRNWFRLSAQEPGADGPAWQGHWQTRARQIVGYTEPPNNRPATIKPRKGR